MTVLPRDSMQVAKHGVLVSSTIAEGGGEGGGGGLLSPSTQLLHADERQSLTDSDESAVSSSESSNLTEDPSDCCLPKDPEALKVLKMKTGDVKPPRQQWSKEVEFVLACVGNAVGLGNLWRFPYLCYDSGGGAFLIPYFIMLIVCGIPLLYMELAMGQYTRQGPVGALKKLCPFFQGAGMGTVMLSFLLCTYYNVILTWAMYYMFSVFQDPLPWSHCNNSWNSELCWGDYSNSSVKPPNNSVSPSQEFYEQRVLQQTDGIEDQGTIIWQLALILLLSWLLVYLCLFKGVRWTGKVVYFTAVFPYIIIITLLVKGLTLPGSEKGVEFFIKPRWELLKDPKVWVNAAAQNFNSIGIAFGSMIAFSSYNKRNNKILRDVMSICILNSATSVLAGFAIFSILGYIALNQGKEVSEVVSEGPGLVFIVYPEAFTTLSFPGSNILAFLFFFMLLCLAIDSQFASVEVVLTTLEDHFGVSLRRILKRKELVVLLVCAVAYLLGLPNITNGGIYFFKLIDSYSSGISLMLIAFFEVIAVAWGYGANRLAKNIEEMTGSRPYWYFLICWFALSPLLIAAIMIFNWIEYTPISYGDYEYPDWGIGIGWLLASLSLVCIPIGIVKAVWEAEGSSFFQKLRNSFRPQLDGTEGVAGMEFEENEFLSESRKTSAANSATVLVDARKIDKALEAHEIQISKF